MSSPGNGSGLAHVLPFVDLRGYTSADLGGDLLAALAVTVLTVPQAMAYAVIAGLPPVMGLYAAAVPALVGSLFRSSRHVMTGPTNALSLLVGSIVAGTAPYDPVQTAVTLAVVTGSMQLAAGVLRLGSLVDYISGPVVLGYITGAGVLIGIGQLANVTGTAGERGNALVQLLAWIDGLDRVSLASIAIAGGSAVLVLVLRRIDKRIPAPLVVLSLGILVGSAFDASGAGLETVSDIASVPTGLPPLTLPAFYAGPPVVDLVTAAIACMVMSFVESSSVGRSIAIRSGQRIDMSTEFVGQGLANVVGGFFGSLPTSGSPSRSVLNHRAGARTRLAGVFAGGLMLAVLLVLGPIVDLTPVASLAGLLIIVALDLIDLERIRTTLRTTRSDALAFVATLLATFVLPLHYAIMLGVGISIVTFLRRARLLVVRELVAGADGKLCEVEIGERPAGTFACGSIRLLHVEGPLFFGAASELQSALDEVLFDRHTRVLVVRVKRTQGMDATAAAVLGEIGRRVAAEGRGLILVGMRPREMAILERSGVAAALGGDNLYPTEPQWFAAMEHALERAIELAGQHDCQGGCPFAACVGLPVHNGTQPGVAPAE